MLLPSDNKFNKMVYSRSAAARILKCDPWEVVRLEVWTYVIFVIRTGCRPTYLSKKLFKADFAESRRRNARSLKATQSLFEGHQFTVTNLHSQSSKSPNRISRYTVTAYPDHFECECRDFRDQVEAGIKQATCKHSYAVIQLLGLSTLQDYIHSVQHGSINKLNTVLCNVGSTFKPREQPTLVDGLSIN